MDRRAVEHAPPPGGRAPDDAAHLGEATRRAERMQLRRLEVASVAEGITLVLLVCVAVPLKHLAGHADAVRVLGPVHGLAFLAFLWTAVQTVAGGGWSGADATRLFVGGLIPFGGFLNLPFLRRRAARLR